MFNLNRYFILKRLYENMVWIEFIYYKQKYLIDFILQLVININHCIDKIALCCKINAIKYLSFISLW